VFGGTSWVSLHLFWEKEFYFLAVVGLLFFLKDWCEAAGCKRRVSVVSIDPSSAF